MKDISAFQDIEKAMKETKDRRMFERYQTIYLHLQGTKGKQIASIINRSFSTVRSYINAYNEAGIPGLDMDHSPGAPVRLTEEQQEKLKRTILEAVPHDVGFKARHNSTLELIADFIKREFGTRYSLRGISKMIHRQGLWHEDELYTAETFLGFLKKGVAQCHTVTLGTLYTQD